MKLRIIGVGIAVIALAAIGDRALPVRSPARTGTVPVAPAGGVLACPIATMGSADAYLYVANVGDTPARARIFLRGEQKQVAVKRIGLAPDKIETLALHPLVDGPSGVVIEWSGGRVVAAHTLEAQELQLTPGRRLPRFFSGAQCTEPQGPELAIVGARTTLVGDTRLALFNPGPAPAVVSIAIRESGEYVEHQRLQRRLVRPLSRRDFSLRGFAFGRDEIAVVIRMDAGRVVAEGLLSNRAGAELLPAIPPLTEGLALASTSGGSARLSLAATERTLIGGSGAIDLPVEMTGARYDGGTFDAPPEIPAKLGRDVPALIQIPGNGQPIGYALSPLSGRIAAGTSWTLSNNGVFDLVSMPAMQPSTTLFGIVPSYGADWSVQMLIAAAGGEEATATLRVIGPRGRTEEIDVPPGSVRSVPISTGEGVHAVVVTSEVPIGASFVARSGGIGYGSTLTSLRIATETSVRGEPEVGIGARAR